MLVRPSLAAAAVLLLFAPSARALSLADAAHSPTLSVAITDATSYRAVRIAVRNTGDTAVTVTAMPGLVLENAVADEQDLTLTEPLAMTVAPGKELVRVVATYCIRPNDHPPTHGVAFQPAGFDPTIANFLHDRYAHRADHEVQSALWNFIDRSEPERATPRNAPAPIAPADDD